MDQPCALSDGEQQTKEVPRAMLYEMNVFGPFIDEDKKNCKGIGNAAFDDFTTWRKSHKIQCSAKRTSFWKVYRQTYGAFLNSKAYNARILTEWLLDLVIRVRALPQPQWNLDPRLPLCEAALKLGNNQPLPVLDCADVCLNSFS